MSDFHHFSGRAPEGEEKMQRCEGTVRADQKEFVERLGDGNRSLGMRRAFQIAMSNFESSPVSMDDFIEQIEQSE